jgi:hypothetical protein
MKVTKDGFVWLVLNQFQIKKAFTVFELYILHDDDSETLIKSNKELIDAVNNNFIIGIEVGQLN